MNTDLDRVWQDLALCQEVDPELFFPDQGDHAGAAAAKGVCAACPVRFECLTDALVRRERWGIWGGMSERKRRAIKHLPHRCEHCLGPVLDHGSTSCGECAHPQESAA
ncbi:WhiB family transcriptional regulator [Nonomuraea sp. NPDC050540]|uniref:WhiB family transcriptional regulator n=1 Tax=Nonomuraea sp. NPDC050540 TaxID=3364367 RepID=UPI0037A187FC